ncbi:MAG: hypothetical protein EOO14_04695 [Chitinophagaceae bacterium]|nr:MAG: hypothetical protein EOO14_04695 [Chitinophagaceae bacterium]
MIPEFSLRFLHNGEFITFSKEVLKITDVAHLPAVVQQRVAQFKTFLLTIEALHVEEDESELSKERREIDAARDRVYSGLAQLADTYRSNPVAEKSEAGRILSDRFADYGTVLEVTRQGDADESADLHSLLRDLGTPRLAAAATLIGAGDWIEALTHLQASFDQKSTERTAAHSERIQEKPENIDTLRPKAAEAYRKLVNSINSFYTTEEGAEPWPGIVGKFSTLIGETRNIMAIRKGRALAALPGGNPGATV